MMKIFDDKATWGSKTNFVDDANVCVGYDNQQDCCEDCDHYFTRELPDEEVHDNSSKHIERPPEDVLVKLRFDPEFFQEHNWKSLDSGGAAVFKLDGDDQPWYLVVYNSHNGYYGHGFKMTVGEDIKHEGTL